MGNGKILETWAPQILLWLLGEITISHESLTACLNLDSQLDFALSPCRTFYSPTLRPSLYIPAHPEAECNTTAFWNSGPNSTYIIKARAEKHREIHLPANNDWDLQKLCHKRLPILVAERILGYKFLILRLQLKSASFLQPSLLLTTWPAMPFSTTIKGKPELNHPKPETVERKKKKKTIISLKEETVKDQENPDRRHIQWRLNQRFSVHLRWPQLSPWREKQRQASNYPWDSGYVSDVLIEDTFTDVISYPNFFSLRNMTKRLNNFF